MNTHRAPFYWGTIYLTFLTPMDCGFSLWATATDCGWEVKYIDPKYCGSTLLNTSGRLSPVRIFCTRNCGRFMCLWSRSMLNTNGFGLTRPMRRLERYRIALIVKASSNCATVSGSPGVA